MDKFSHLSLLELECVRKGTVSKNLQEKIKTHCEVCSICSERIKIIKEGGVVDNNANASWAAATKLLKDLEQ